VHSLSPLRKRGRGAIVAVVALASLVTTRAHADPSSTSPEQGYDLGEVQTPRAVAMAGALNALGTSTTSLFLNPANLPIARVYHFEGFAAVSPESRRQSYGGAVADSSTNRIAGGFGGTWSSMDPDGIKRTWTDLHLGVAYPLGDKFSLGATGRYLRVGQLVARGPFGASLPSDGTPADPMYNNFTFDLGATVIPTQQLRIGVVGHNLTNPHNGLAPTLLAGGVGFTSDIFSVEGDALVDFTTFSRARGRFMLGGEAFLANHFPLRLGYRYDDGQRTHAITAGFGYIDKKWSFEIGGRRDVAADKPATMIVAGLRYFYDAGRIQPDEADPVGY
jgi:hypothetical protein